MGMINIYVEGSFGQFDYEFKHVSNTYSAMKHGHEYATRQAIDFLENTLLPSAIENDKKCKEQGVEPKEGFKEYENE